MKKLVLVILELMRAQMLPACLILFITDGKNILVANHEDWYAEDAEISFVPAAKNKLGMVYFDFASEGTAQGGMNTAGLFFDGTATPRAAYPSNQSKKDCHCYIWKKILEECSTVDQAIKLVEQYRIPEMERIHVLFADSLGNAAIIGVFNGQLQVHRNNSRYQLLTNFNITNPSFGGESVCRRFTTAENMLKQDSSVTVENLKKILSKTHQEKLTVYSNIYDLSKREVYVYSKLNFNKTIKIQLLEELKKGKHSVLIKDFFKRK
ncbi:MAG: carcinine hydrolase/isopenicillin-N N-acyltransferase family protein [Chitinophagaceae bacterium]